MDNREKIIQATIDLINEKGEKMNEITVRDICKRKTFCLITAMQQAFLRHKVILPEMGVDLADSRERGKFHIQILHDILEV